MEGFFKQTSGGTKKKRKEEKKILLQQQEQHNNKHLCDSHHTSVCIQREGQCLGFVKLI